MNFLPISFFISDHKEQYLAWGILQVFRGVAFLHEANLVHGSLHSGSIFVTPGGDWKLFGFEQMKSTSDQNSSKGHWPGLSKYAPPELQKNSYMDLTPAQVIEKYFVKMFSCLSVNSLLF